MPRSRSRSIDRLRRGAPPEGLPYKRSRSMTPPDRRYDERIGRDVGRERWVDDRIYRDDHRAPPDYNRDPRDRVTDDRGEYRRAVGSAGIARRGDSRDRRNDSRGRRADSRDIRRGDSRDRRRDIRDDRSYDHQRDGRDEPSRRVATDTRGHVQSLGAAGTTGPLLSLPQVSIAPPPAASPAQTHGAAAAPAYSQQPDLLDWHNATVVYDALCKTDEWLPPGWECVIYKGVAVYLDHLSREAFEDKPWEVWARKSTKAAAAGPQP